MVLALGMEGNDADFYGGRTTNSGGVAESGLAHTRVFEPTLQGGDKGSSLGDGFRSTGQDAAGGLDAPTPSPAAIPTPTAVAEGDTAPAGAGEPALGEQRDGSANTRAGEDIAATICSYSWDCATAIGVFTCESGLRAEAVSWNGTSYGITQIWQGHAWRWPNFWQDWSNPEVNIGWAFELWSEQGWEPWDCR